MAAKLEHPNFKDEKGKVYLVRCPKCGKENWAPAVAHGICAWCGYNANGGKNEQKNGWSTKAA
ncbi:hypothetical protein IKF88_02485 [Candidatus Saccharibacteria bacterium]|nr:hypothetical protein [Candidatus Saccharibacteria bacterium]